MKKYAQIISIAGAGTVAYILYKLFAHRPEQQTNNMEQKTNLNGENIWYMNNDYTTIGYRNYNPLNIRKNQFVYPGQVSNYMGFKQFKNMPYGYRAAIALIKNSYIAKGYKTVQDIIYRWAPPADNNNTSSYVSNVCQRTGFNPATVISTKEQIISLVYAMAISENGATPSPNLEEIEAGWNLL